jgi:hypothetical protein
VAGLHGGGELIWAIQTGIKIEVVFIKVSSWRNDGRRC